MAAEKLKEYGTGVMVAAVMRAGDDTCGGTLSGPSTPRSGPRSIGLDAERVDNEARDLYGEIIGRLDRMENRLDRRFARIDERFEQVDDQGSGKVDG